MAERRRDSIAFISVFYMGLCLMYHLYTAPDTIDTNEDYPNTVEKTLPASSAQRKPLSALNYEESNTTGPWIKNVNCTAPDIEQFPRPVVDYATRRKGGLILHIFVSLYMLLGLAIICDEYFVPSLEKICKLLNIQSDVAGATFMAAGSSAPELATAVIAVFIAQDDIGIGTVVGSAVFNIAFVIGICGVFAGRAIHLNWWPLFRDCMFYLLSILALLFALRDESVTWVESVLFLFLYSLYIVFMCYNQKIEKWMKSLRCMSCLTPRVSEPINGVSYHALPDLGLTNLEGPENKLTTSVHTDSSLEASLPPTEEEEESSIFSPPGGKLRKFIWFLSLPILMSCYFTIPDCRRSKWEKFFLITFLSSCIWIGVFSYVLVWMITVIGFTLHIKDTIMGLTFLAAGASIPDAISSLIVVREGLGDMAVSNAVGSNVFDILLCLGLPWFLQTAVVSPGSHIIVRSRGLTYSTITLLLTVVFLLLATHLNRWRLDKKYGGILLAWYGIFMVVAVLYESSLFGNIGLPMCPSDF
ncbi:probable sodium/potassium/calcium exchanger CG1090 isoform X2 [Argiope bruennichi]|uniref:Sodium/potassium/calcium exchanger 5 like protein n=2 Tax=Argiope bruennichi TaxID=94029 RepID=A0A8T0EIF2_ARGBR|nr:probable sodium/potassium/calcium exchanger CG1090 isoform X2 [Argiope bruennichi]XP_055950470.1 probable sodium/potassium/calcium exchanger CG1090 isoform X2 [Argiope bruennichi]XP_055950471.1 probable sodium/potassium/calcium exchanger CG1090 isoform X2 [Argiope bruennichi]XP_055950472.1 probable sodium/potassium/calcium exchanger CG1090 isoform X2 [Argiope bruennichi]KAF8773358.1 Sodium/potassium/calcium exchanger 5 like protein [Argiope bruennichi]